MSTVDPKTMRPDERIAELNHLLGLRGVTTWLDMRSAALTLLVVRLAQPHGGGRANIADAERVAQLLKAEWDDGDTRAAEAGQ